MRRSFFIYKGPNPLREEGFFMDKKELDPFRDQLLSRGIFYAFIPHQLEIPDRPELSVFPFNVMFARYKVENGKTIMGSTVYEPELDSYVNKETKHFMKYINKYGGGGWLIIQYDSSDMSYRGEKFINEESIGKAWGSEWKNFFIHFTALGLSTNERCEFQ
jgi:hypothetical protein